MRTSDFGARLLLCFVVALFFVPALIWLTHPDRGMATTGLASAPVVLGRSLLVAGGGALCAMVLGGLFAVAISAYRVPAIGWLTPLFLAPLLLPAVVVTTGVQAWLADGSLVFLVRGVLGAIVLSTIQMAPLVLWGVTRSLAAMPREELVSMRASLSPPRVARLLIPRARPIALRFGALAFLLLLPRLEVPAYTGIETIGRRTLAAFTADGSDVEGWIWCALCLLIALPILPFATAPLAIGTSPASLGRRERGAPHSRVVTGVALLVAALPLVLVVGLAIDALDEGLGGGGESQRWLSALGLELLRVVPLAIALAVLGWRLAIGIGRFGRLLVSLPLFLPGCLPALLWIEGAMPYLPAGLADTVVPLNVAQGLRFVGIALLFGSIAHHSIPRAERDAAQLLPPSAARWRVLFPRALAGIVASTTLLIAFLLGEVESAAQVVPPGKLLPAVELHQLLHYRYDVQAARLSLALVALYGIVVLCIGRVGAAKEERL